MKFNYRSYEQLIKVIFRNSVRFRDFDLIVGIPRSGLVPASLLATHLDLPLSTLPDILYEKNPFVGYRKLKTQKPLKEAKILIVDDSVCSGRQIEKVKKLLNSQNCSFKTLAVYATETGKDYVDFWIEELAYPRLFQWNILNHEIASRACYDLDGVLCRDPQLNECANEKPYIAFLSSCDPWHIPSHPIKAIVTSRLERYRRETEEWLERQNVRYEQLIMLDGISSEQRREFMLHAAFKSEVYKALDADLFIESSRSQAITISRISSKPCFAVEDMNMYYGDIASKGIHLSSFTEKMAGNKIDPRGLKRLKDVVSHACKRFMLKK